MKENEVNDAAEPTKEGGADNVQQQAELQEGLTGDRDEPVEVEQVDEPTTLEKEEEPESSTIKDGAEGQDSEEIDESSAGNDEPSDDETSEDEPHEEEETDEYEGMDFAAMDRSELLQVIADLSGHKDPRRAETIAKDIQFIFSKVFNEARTAALDKFVEDGGEASDFEYKSDPDKVKFDDYFKIIRERKARHFQELEKQKDVNLERKNELLEKLRQIVDGEESTTSINALKSLQEEWRAIGPVPGAHNKTLWANYNALIDRFYDNRSIYFELKELDRKKNLDAKLELCIKAERLDEEENIKEAVKQLNELHDEFKHIGPVPKDDQEALWLRFKAASDKIYVKRKGFVDQLKTELKENMEKKLVLGDDALEFLQFDSDRINAWNDKTKQLLELQKKWETIGGLPREHAKEVNKKFWGAFKGFFANKNKFFKRLESMRDDNLAKKNELVAKAEALIDSTDWQATAEELKRLQREWREIGPVPEKVRNEVYQKFKAACDQFFEKKREQNKGADKEYEANLKEKETICEKLESLAKKGGFEQSEVFGLQEAFGKVGFVPRNAIKKIQKRYEQALEAVMTNTGLDEDDLNRFKANLSVNKLKMSPHGDRKLNRKEQGLRKRITQLEGDLNTWKTNMEFFASSAKADQLKDQFESKIKEAEVEIDTLKAELRAIRQN